MRMALVLGIIRQESLRTRKICLTNLMRTNNKRSSVRENEFVSRENLFRSLISSPLSSSPSQSLGSCSLFMSIKHPSKHYKTSGRERKQRRPSIKISFYMNSYMQFSKSVWANPDVVSEEERWQARQVFGIVRPGSCLTVLDEGPLKTVLDIQPLYGAQSMHEGPSPVLSLNRNVLCNCLCSFVHTTSTSLQAEFIG